MFLKLTDVTKEYHVGTSTVLGVNNVSLSINEGGIIVVMGSSGSGKTTLLNLIGGLDELTNGNIEFKGVELPFSDKRFMQHYRRDNIGFVFQSYYLTSVLSVFENVEYPLLLNSDSSSTRKKKVMKTLDEVGLGGLAKNKPSQLSGGQKQRVAIARAIVTEPKLLFADEPTANLDEKTSSEILELIKHLTSKNKTTCIINTHDPLVLKYARRCIVFKDGKVIEDSKK
jgi:putative ABC transport system ATP-binding protein